MSKTRTLGLGLIGCGAFGIFCLENYRKLADIKPIALADVRADVVGDIANQLHLDAYENVDDMLKRPDIDIVHIATPPSSHYELARKVISAGKHVLCEKPLAINTTEADEMLRLAWNEEKIMPVNFVLRYNEVTHAVKRIIESGLLGAPLSARLTNCAGDTPLDKNHWFWNREISGGIFIEHGVHFFDLYRHWFGPGEVTSSLTAMRPGTDQQDRVTCTVKHYNGCIASHYHGFDQISLIDRTTNRIVFERGDIWVDGWIPLFMTIDAVLDDTALGALTDLCPEADVKILDEIPADKQHTTGRGKDRYCTKHVRIYFCPEHEKQRVYSTSVQKLMEDQLAYVHNHKHQREVIEINGREALAMAQAAACMAKNELRK